MFGKYQTSLMELIDINFKIKLNAGNEFVHPPLQLHLSVMWWL